MKRPRGGSAMLATVGLAVVLVGCPRHISPPAGTDGVSGPPAAAPRPLVPRYHEAPDFALVFFDDCHCEFDGDDSVHFSRRYAFDEGRAVLWIAGRPAMESHADGTFVEPGAHDAGLWDRVADRGRMYPVDDEGKVRQQPHPRFPDPCRCAGDGCRRDRPARQSQIE